MNYKYIASSMREGIEELNKIATSADAEILTESDFKQRMYAMLLDVFRAYNLRDADLEKADYYNSAKPPEEIIKLFKN